MKVKIILFWILIFFITNTLFARSALSMADKGSLYFQGKAALSLCKKVDTECKNFFKGMKNSENYSYQNLWIIDYESNEVVQTQIIYKNDKSKALVRSQIATARGALFPVMFLSTGVQNVEKMLSEVSRNLTNYVNKVNEAMQDVVKTIPAINRINNSAIVDGIDGGKIIGFKQEFISWKKAENISDIKNQITALELRSNKIKPLYNKISTNHWRKHPLSKLAYKLFSEKSIHSAKKAIKIPVFDGSSNNKFSQILKPIRSKLTGKTSLRTISQAKAISSGFSTVSAGLGITLGGLDIQKGIDSGNEYLIAKGSLSVALGVVDLTAIIASNFISSAIGPVAFGLNLMTIPVFMMLENMEQDRQVLEGFVNFYNSEDTKNFLEKIKETNAYSEVWASLSIGNTSHWYSQMHTDDWMRSNVKRYISNWQAANGKTTSVYPYNSVSELDDFKTDYLVAGSAGANNGKTFYPIADFNIDNKGLWLIGGKSCDWIKGSDNDDFIDPGTLSTDGYECECRNPTVCKKWNKLKDTVLGYGGDDTILIGEGLTYEEGSIFDKTGFNIDGGIGKDTLLLEPIRENDDGNLNAVWADLSLGEYGWKKVTDFCKTTMELRLTNSSSGYYRKGKWYVGTLLDLSERDKRVDCFNNYAEKLISLNDNLMPYTKYKNHLKIDSITDLRNYQGPYIRLVTMRANKLAWDYPNNEYIWDDSTLKEENLNSYGTMKNIENLVGTKSSDKLIGDNKNNKIEGNGGADYIFAKGGDDEIYGGEDGKKSKIDAGSGDDIIYFGEAVVYPGRGDDILENVDVKRDNGELFNARIYGSLGDDTYNIGKAYTKFGNIGLSTTGNDNEDEGNDTVVINYEDTEFASFINTWRENSGMVRGFYWGSPKWNCAGSTVRCPDETNVTYPVLLTKPSNMEELKILFKEFSCSRFFPLAENDYFCKGKKDEIIDKSFVLKDNIFNRPAIIYSDSGLNSSEFSLENIDDSDVVYGFRSDFVFPNNSDTYTIKGSNYRANLIFLPKVNTDNADFTDKSFNIKTGNKDDVIFVGIAKEVNVSSGNGDDILIAPNELNTKVIFNAEEGNDLLRGSIANDILMGGKGSDIIRGFNGNDYIKGGIGVNRLYGGKGTDIYEISNNENSIIEDSYSNSFLTCIDVDNLSYEEIKIDNEKIAKLSFLNSNIYIYNNENIKFYIGDCNGNFTHVLTSSGLTHNDDSNITIQYNEIKKEFVNYINKETSTSNFKPEVNKEKIDTVINMRGFITPISRESLSRAPSQEEINMPGVGRTVFLPDSSLNLDNLKYITVESCCTGTMHPEKVTIKVPENFAQTNQTLWLKFSDGVDIRGVKVKIEIIEGSYGKKIRVVPIEARYYTGSLKDYDFNSPLDNITFNPIQLIPANKSDQRGYGIKNVELHFATEKFYLKDKFLEYNNFVRASGVTIKKTDNIQTISNLRVIRARGHQEDGTSLISENFYTMAPIPADFRSGDELWFKYYIYGILGSEYVKGIKVRIDEYDDRFELTPIKCSYKVLNNSLINDVKAQSTDGEFNPYTSLIDLETQPSFTLARSITSGGYGMKEVRMVFSNKTN